MRTRRRQRGSQGLFQYVAMLVFVVGGFALVQYTREAPERERAAIERAAKQQAAARAETKRRAERRKQQAEVANKQREQRAQADERARRAQEAARAAPAQPPAASLGAVPAPAGPQNEAAPPLAPSPALPSDWMRATLRRSATLDLETGAQSNASPRSQDLWWRARTATEHCLCPRYSASRTPFALVEPGAFRTIDGRGIAALDFSIDGFEQGDGATQAVRPGLTFAVRTIEGNLAKLRVVGLTPANELTVEWRIFAKDGAGITQAISANPSLALVDLRIAIYAARRARDKPRTLTLLGEMEALAGRLPAGDVRRIDARREIGWTYYVSGARVQALPVLVAAAKDLEANDRLPAGQRASWELAGKTFRALGIVFRAQRRDKEAAPAFGQAVERTAAAKPQGASETRRHAMTLARNLQELATTQCRIGQTGEAQKNFERIRAVCKPPINPATTWFCRPERLRCPAR